MITVVHPNASMPVCYDIKQFQEAMGVSYLSQLEFIDPTIYAKVLKRCIKEERKGWIESRQKWLGCYYSKEIKEATAPDVTIFWINDAIGYGVRANRDIPRNSYIGEYTGVVRKRRFFGRLSNHYCFDYTIGVQRKTSYVIDARDQGNFTRYINHSDQGNIETASILSNGVMHIILYAGQDIPQGAQLCYDYGSKYWENRTSPSLLNT